MADKKNYDLKIQELTGKVNQLNTPSNPPAAQEISALLQGLRQADVEYLTSLRLKVIRHALFTRHGQSNVFLQKRLGLMPNSPISKRARKNMQMTNEFTHGFLAYPNEEIDVRVSPLIRTKETASLLLPKGHAQLKIRTEGALTETTPFPSGKDIRTLESYRRRFKKISFWKNPLKKILYALSWLFFGNAITFRKIQDISQATDVALKNANKNREALVRNDGKVHDEDKPNKIYGMLTNSATHSPSDTWLFGHGLNFKRFFNQFLGESKTFGYTETRSVYIVEGPDGNTHFYRPPYSLAIDQSTGFVRAEYERRKLKLVKTPTLPSACNILSRITQIKKPHPMHNQRPIEQYKKQTDLMTLGIFPTEPNSPEDRMTKQVRLVKAHGSRLGNR